MNMVSLILKKDLRRLRVFIGFWLLISVLTSVASILSPSTEDVILRAVLELSLVLVRVLQIFLMALIVPFLMHEEPTVGTTAFWLTRPVSRTDVLKAKALFAGLFFVLIPVLCNALMLAANAVPFGYLVPAALADLLEYTSAVLLLMAIASMTRNFGGYALVGGVYLMIGIVVAVIINSVQQFGIGGSVSSIGLTDTRNLLESIAAIAVLSGLVIHQFRGRRLIRAYILLTFQFVLTGWIAMVFPWSIFPPLDTPLSDELAGRIETRVDHSQRHYVSEVFTSRKSETPQKRIDGDLEYDGLPKHAFAWAVKIESKLELNGKSYGDTAATVQNDQPRFTAVGALQDLIEPAFLHLPMSRTIHNSVLLKLPAAKYEEIKSMEGCYTADLELQVFQYLEAGRLSLEPGSVYAHDRTRIIMDSLLNETDGCIVMLREQFANPLLRRDRTPTVGPRLQYVLINRKTDEAYLPEDNPVDQISQQLASTRGVQGRSLHFTSGNKQSGIIDEAWLADAELLIVQTAWLGKTTKQVTEPDFRIPDMTIGFNMEQGRSAKDNIAQLAELDPLNNPTRDEVKTYILKIHAISATQSSQGHKDPQIAMLTDLGREHLDLILRNSGVRSYYTIRAAKNLAQAEDKNLILAELARMPDLAQLVVKFEWQEEARTILLRRLERDSYLPGEWIQAVVMLNDPTTYPALTRFLARGENPATTYRHIKDLPNIELDEAVSKAWKKAKNDYEYRRVDMECIALGYGVEDALKSAFRDLSNLKETNNRKNKLRKSIKKHTGLKGSDEELAAWYETNQAKLRFNPETRMYASGTVVQKLTGGTPAPLS